MRFAGQAVVGTVAALALGAGILRHDSGADTAEPASRNASAAEAPAARPLPSVAPEDRSPSGGAQRLYLLHHDQDLALEKQARAGKTISAEELARFRELQVRVRDLQGEVLRSLEADPSGWGRIVEDLAPFAEDPTARKIVMELRDRLGPAAARPLAGLLGPTQPRPVRRLALPLLQNQSGGEILGALSEMAERDPEASLRKEALEVLAAHRPGLPEGSAARSEIEETFRRMSAAERDPVLRARALELSAPPHPSAPAAPRPRRGPFGS